MSEQASNPIREAVNYLKKSGVPEPSPEEIAYSIRSSIIRSIYEYTKNNAAMRAAYVGCLQDLPIVVVDSGVDTAAVAEVKGRLSFIINKDFAYACMNNDKLPLNLSDKLPNLDGLLMHEGGHIFTYQLHEIVHWSRWADPRLHNICADAWLNDVIDSLGIEGVQLGSMVYTREKVIQEFIKPTQPREAVDKIRELIYGDLSDWWDMYNILKKKGFEGKVKEVPMGDEVYARENPTIHTVDCETITASSPKVGDLDKQREKGEAAARQVNQWRAAAGLGSGGEPEQVTVQHRRLYDWRQVLTDIISTGIPVEWRTRWYPPPRWIHEVWRFTYPFMPMYPKYVPQYAGKIVAGVDTSGSISAEMLNYFVSGIVDIINQLYVRAVVVPWDVRVYDDRAFEVLPGQTPSVVTLTGGGGTEPTPLAEYVAKEHPDASAVVVFTDMCFMEPASDVYTAFGNLVARGIKVVWVTVAGDNCVDIGHYDAPPPTQPLVRIKMGQAVLSL